MAHLVEKVNSLEENEKQQSLSGVDKIERLEAEEEPSLVRSSMDIY